MRQYNRRYLRHDKATDVMAFPFSGAKSRSDGVWKILGDVLISSDTALRQAHEMRHSLEQEIKTLMIHGLLHLLGYQDHSPREASRMWRKTHELLEGDAK